MKLRTQWTETDEKKQRRGNMVRRKQTGALTEKIHGKCKKKKKKFKRRGTW